jgi:hypothetical protein
MFGNDISKCSGKDCPLKESCYRYTCKSNKLWQSHFSYVPYDKDKKECNMYWEVNLEVDKKNKK